jgi:AcrR family transcriptional regulator
MAEQVKRPSPRERTRRDLLAAARELLADGEPLTVQAVADRAGVSRATAYRYFASNDAVALNATLPRPEDPFGDAAWPYPKPTADQPTADRVATLVRGMAEWAFDHDRELRTVLALSLQPDAEERGFSRMGKLGRFTWIDTALADLPAGVTREQRRRLRAALLPLFGADALIWTADVAGLQRKQAVDQLAWTARTLVQAVIDEARPKPQ